MAILFGDFCLLLEKIARSSKAHVLGNTQGKYKQVPSPQDIFRTWLSALQHPSHFDGLLIFRLLFPEQDIRRRYGFKETLLARELSAALGFAPPPSLINWNSSGAPQDENIFGAKHGCFGLCLRDALQHRTALSQGTSSVTITQIDTLLDELACHCDFSSADVKRKQKLTGKTLRPRRAILHDLFSSISSTEAAYLCQIILRDLSPLLYPVPSSSSERSLLLFNASSWKTLDLVPALELWHWALPTIFKYKADLDAAFEVLSARNHALQRYDDAAHRQSILKDLAKPAVGSRIGIPSAVKGRNCAVVAESIRKAGVAYAEVKYDGERMQIHFNRNASPCITIFSKSKRDSTTERFRTHPIILAALGLPPDLSGVVPSPHHLARLQEAATSSLSTRDALVESIILEAEMVAYNEDTEDIDEFANLHLCAGLSGDEARAPILDSSQTDSDGSGDRQLFRHLAVVFFDVLWLNGRNLVLDSYKARRALLESTILPVEGYSMLATRTRLDFRGVDATTAQQELIRVFASCIVNRNEGLMIKTEASVYNDNRRCHRWTKLKRDYIPGLGDSLTCCIVAAAWTKDRARELHVPTGCFTTFYVGALRNDMELQNGVTDKPCYEVLFGVSYMANRSMLLRANHLLGLNGGVNRVAWTGRIAENWSFDMMIPINLQSEIQFVLAQPLVFELYGAGFSRRRGSSLYELRFPRVSAIHEFRRPSEAVTLSELQSLAKESLSWIGSEAESEVDDMWSKHSSASGGETSGDSATDWRARQQEHWVKKLTRACQPRTGRRSRRLQQTDHNGSYPAQTMLDPTGVAEDAACSEDIHHETGNENGFNEQQPYLWTCLPYQIAPRILLPTSYRVASLESLLFMVSSLRKISAPVQAVILLEEPLSSDGVTWIQELVRNWHEDGSDLRQTSQVWLHPLPNLNDEPEYRVEALNVATMRVLTRPN